MKDIRLLHFADLHLGVESYGKVDATTGLSTRVRDYLDRLDEVVAFAQRERVDAVLFAGDCFHNCRPAPTYQRDFATRVSRLARAGIAVVLEAGNHDMPMGGQGKATPLDVFRALEVPNVYVVDEGVTEIPLDGRSLQIAAMPYPNRSRLLGPNGFRGKGLQAQDEAVRALVAEHLAQLAGQVDPARPAVLLAHLLVLGSAMGTEGQMALGSQPEVTLDMLTNSVYQAVLLGHVHRGQVLADAPFTAYSGSLERIDFGDEGLEKGFYVVEIGNSSQRRVHTEFVPVSPRAFVTVAVDTRQDEDPMPRIWDEVARVRATGVTAGAVVRVKLQLAFGQVTRLDETALRKAFPEALFLANVGKAVEMPTREKLEAAVLERLRDSPLEAVRWYWDSQGVSKPRQQKLAAALQELLGEEVMTPALAGS